MPKWGEKEPSKKRLPPREKLPQLGEVIRRTGALCPSRRRPGRGLSGLRLGRPPRRGAGSGDSGCGGGQSAKAGPWRGEGVISGQEAEAGSRWGGGGSHAAPRGGRGQRPGRARRTAGCGPDPGLRPTRVPDPAPASTLHLFPSSPRPRLPRNSAAPNLGETFPTSDRAGGARRP